MLLKTRLYAIKNRKIQKYTVHVKIFKNMQNKTLYFGSIDYNLNL
jgi:hypothetical protein